MIEPLPDAVAVDDVARVSWFLTDAERGNPAASVRGYTVGNAVTPLVHGAAYFPALRRAIDRLGSGDELYFAGFRTDGEQRLDGPGTAVREVLIRAVERGVRVFGLVWRSQPSQLEQSEQENAKFARELTEAGAEVALDARTRRGGSHHQKLVVCRGPATHGVAFLGGIDLAFSRADDDDHQGDDQVMPFPDVYGERPPWHDVQVSIEGPAVVDVEKTFRERWAGSSLDVPSPFRMLVDRVRHATPITTSDLPEPRSAPDVAGTQAVQILRTYPSRLRRYPFAPLGERSIAAAYRKCLRRARRLVYIEDQYLWAPGVAHLLAEALRTQPTLRMVVVVPRYPDKEGTSSIPSLVGRERTIEVCRAAGPDRFAIYDVENAAGNPVYVHAKVVVIDDVWAMVGSDNMNRRSWTHDSELSCAVLDARHDDREPTDAPGLGDGARVFARNLRLELWREHLERQVDGSDDAGLLDPDEAFETMAATARRLDEWYEAGKQGPRPPGRLRRHTPERVSRRDRPWAVPVSRLVYDPDGRAWRDRLLRRP